MIAIDLDDTLLTEEKTIQQRDRDAIQGAQDDGHLITIATSRMWPHTRPFVEDLGLTGPMIACSGAYTVDFDGETATPRRTRYVPQDAARRIIAHATQQGMTITASYDLSRAVAANTPLDWQPSQVSLRVDRELHETLDRDVDQLVVGGMEYARRMEREAAEGKGLNREWEWLQWMALPLPEQPRVLHILHPEATKGDALMGLAAESGVAPEDTIALGDGYNDISMLQDAGTGVAMGWAPRTVQKTADTVLDVEAAAPVAAALNDLL